MEQVGINQAKSALMTASAVVRDSASKAVAKIPKRKKQPPKNTRSAITRGAIKKPTSRAKAGEKQGAQGAAEKKRTNATPVPVGLHQFRAAAGQGGFELVECTEWLGRPFEAVSSTNI